VRAGGLRLAGDFQAAGSLAGDDVGIVVGSYQGRLALCQQAFRHLVPGLAVAVVEHHHGA
jgi:hypothetical protein